jgi:acyl carrier protein
MTREEIIPFVNKAIREEHGMPLVNGSDKLIDTGCDSFGVVMVLLALEDKYGIYTN